jgi:peroxiredoxin
MSCRIAFWSLGFTLAWLPLLAASSLAEDASAAGRPPAALGRVQQFSLQDPQGNTHTPGEWQRAKAVVLLFLATDCPISNGYAPAMAKLSREFGPRDVWFAGVYCDPDVTAASAAKHATEYRLPFPVLLDLDQILARQTRVRVTPEAVVLQADGEIVYRGRIDDLYAAPGKRRQQPTTRELASAIEAVLNGKRPAPAETKANGCPLPPLEDSKSTGSKPTDAKPTSR